jgi:hypothetical protein
MGKMKIANLAELLEGHGGTAFEQSSTAGD